MPQTKKQIIGKLGEGLAIKYLLKNGFEILYRNYKLKIGEIDIIAKRNGEIIFVEVKTRKKVLGNMFGFPEEAVDRKKILKISNTGRYFLRECKYPENAEWRIDIISIELNWKTRMAKVKHFKNIS